MNIYIKDKYQKLTCFGYAKPKGTVLIQIFALCNKLLQLLSTTSKTIITVINTALYPLLALSCGSQGAKKKSLAVVKRATPSRHTRTVFKQYLTVQNRRDDNLTTVIF